MKKNRQELILRLIREKAIETQEDLAKLLAENGFITTQGTVSRDIKELNLVKVSTPTGSYRYSVKAEVPGFNTMAARFVTILKETVIRVDVSTSFVVIKTYAGMANAAASSIDNMQWDEIVGTIAGDDTIFIALKNAQDAVLLADKLKELL